MRRPNSHDPIDAPRRLSDLPASLPERFDSSTRPAKIQPWHLERMAIVYVRQSSPHQVLVHKESAAVQANLRDLAIAWGWPPDRVIVVTGDQAHSGTSTDGRHEFTRILTEVNLNHVGILLGFQVSRLSRANSDWYHLLERCAVFHTLLADQDGLYDPSLYNDRLLLGLKGTMSEAELHFLRQRLVEARWNKARRGELFTAARTGYVRLPGDQLALDPDEQVRHVIRLIFDKFDELGTVGALLRYLVRHDIKLGMRVQGGPDTGRLEWHPPLRSTLHAILRHPIYAGCYVYGFSRTDPRRKKPGVPHSGTVRVDPSEWEVKIPGKVPAYITWDRYLANQKRLADHRCLPTTPGAPRRGPALLCGLVYCGRCGRRMQVDYHANSTQCQYVCRTARFESGAPLCQSFSGGTLEALVTEEVLRALEPAELELSLQAVADLEREHRRQDQHWQQRLERARIEAERAARRYRAVEPECRLVARELERSWEQALAEHRELQEQYDRFVAETPRQETHAERRRVEALASNLPEMWHGPGATIQDRKTIVRCLVERITVAVRGQTEWVDATIHWFGGLETRYELRRPVQKYEQLSNYRALRDRAVELRRGGATMAAIAERLNQEGFHPPKGPHQFTGYQVDQFLARQGLLGSRAPQRIKPDELQRHEWRLGDLARELGMAINTLRGWYHRGWVLGRKSAATQGAWILWADDKELERLGRLRAWRPDGYGQPRPSELTTPRCPNPGGRNSATSGSRHSGKDADLSQRRTHK
jgi:DNA invertase Pin-like site-specific DNA recombinase